MEFMKILDEINALRLFSHSGCIDGVLPCVGYRCTVTIRNDCPVQLLEIDGLRQGRIGDSQL